MKELIKKFTDEKIIDFSKVISIDNQFYLVGAELKHSADKIKKQPAHIGVYLGRSDKPSLFLLQELAKHAKRKIWLTEKGEWLFICKRDIMGPSITKTEGEINVKDFVLVLNQYDECVGYGKVVQDLSSKDVVVKRIFDIGDFLRRERKK